MKLTAMVPSPRLIAIVTSSAFVFVALAWSPLAAQSTALIAGIFGVMVIASVAADAALSLAQWKRAPLTATRLLPQAFAVGVPTLLRVRLDNTGDRVSAGQFFEASDASLFLHDMPLRFAVPPGRSETLVYRLTPMERGLKRFDAAQIRWRSRLGLLDWNLRIGEPQSRRVFPNFAPMARYAWLAGDRRLAEMGIKAFRRRGAGTVFNQLADYQVGDPIRHVDWKATLKHQRTMVRQFHDERDQNVIFLLDCGRRMRADDTQQAVGESHFDQSLDAVMLLAYVALRHGDAVGALTFGTPDGEQKRFAPRKGRNAFNALMSHLSDVQATRTFSDYPRAAAELFKHVTKRSLVIIITDCRDEDSAELGAALRLLQSRHMVVLANLRETVVGDIAAQPLTTPGSALEVAAALAYGQARQDMHARLKAADVLLIDCEPQQLGVGLVNRYTALKRAGSL